MKSQKVEFEGAFGDKLAARLELPDVPLRATAIFAHCFTCSKDVVAASRISRALAKKGVAVLRFDFTGLGGSDGDFANTTFSSNVADLVAAASYLRDSWEAPSMLIGHSLGGAAVLCAAHELEEVLAVATIGAPYDPAHVEHLLSGDVEEIEEEGVAEVQIAGRAFTMRREFLEDLRSSTATEKIGKLRRPLLVLHSPVDEVVAVENARHIFEAAKHPKSFISLDTADHMLSAREDAEYVADVLAAWAARYVAVRDENVRSSFDDAHEGEHDVIVTETGAGKFSNIVRVGAHTLLADEPGEYGGDGTGPSPYEYLMAAVGACSTMTMRLYADRKGWTVTKLEVHLRHGKVHAEDCIDCSEADKKVKVDQIEKHIIIEGDLTEDQRRRIFEVSKKCPVHRTLQSPMQIESILESS